ncbi:MAG: SOS response-associated peptidase [Wenzhouxiangellaceae bacterium]|nr:SOS response-associated peptidase [Wenzhouxiangellaceae bacterium]
MCGRGALDYDWKTLWAWLDLSGTPPDGGVHRLNVAPSTRRRGEVEWKRLPVVRAGDEGRRVDELVWPLIPAWTKGDLPKFSTANCRSEPEQPFSATVAKKPAFRNAWNKARRCLVPMCWFYEWDKRPREHGEASQPWRVFPADDPLLVMAGLWERSPTAGGDPLESFTIITTSPNRLLESIGHSRSPVLLRPEAFAPWLTGTDDEAEALIGPPDDDLLEAEPVTRRVNNPEYQGKDLAGPARAGVHDRA